MKLLLNPTVLTCTITIGDWAACTGIQKLIGFSRGWHHWNSIRLGYNRSEGDKTRLHLYAYVGGKSVQKFICEVIPNEEIIAKLIFSNRYTAIDLFQGDSLLATKTHFFDKQYTYPIGYLLRPYAEIDGTEIKTPLVVDIKDLKINGKIVKIK